MPLPDSQTKSWDGVSAFTDTIAGGTPPYSISQHGTALIPPGFVIDADTGVITNPPIVFDYTTIPDLDPSDRNIYVSTSGDNANDGLTPETPKADWFSAGGNNAADLMRTGHGDRMLLKRGDTWTITVGGGDTGEKRVQLHGGFSTGRPMMLWSYGVSNVRPKIIDTYAHVTNGGTPCSHVWVVGIELERVVEAAVNNDAGVKVVVPNGSSDFLVEDCKISKYSANLNCQGNSPVIDRPGDLRLRKSILVDAYSTGGSAQGLFIDATDGVLIEGNTLDHNGYRDGDASNTLNHNLYLQTTNSGVVVRGNILARDDSGNQCRNGGVIELNVYVNNPYHTNAGAWPDHTYVRYNLFVGGRNQTDYPIGQSGLTFCVEVGPGPDNELFAEDDFSDAASDTELNARDYDPGPFRRWNVAEGDGKAVATGSLYAKSISASPVHCSVAYDADQGGQSKLTDEAQINLVPMDSALGVNFFINSASDTAFTNTYRVLVYRDGSDHDWVAITKVVASVETDIVRNDLGLNYLTWGTDAIGVYYERSTTTLDVHKGVPDNDGRGVLLATSEDATFVYGFYGFELPAMNARVKQVENHATFVFQPVDVYQNLGTITDNEDPLTFGSIRVGGSPHDVRIYENKFYGFDGPSVTATTPINDNNHFTDNEFILNATGDTRYAASFDGEIDSQWHFLRNTWVLGAAGKWTRRRNSTPEETAASATWVTWSGETGGVYGVMPSYPDPTRGVTSYMTHIGGTGTLAAFYAKIRQLSKLEPDEGIDVVALNDYVRAGFNMRPVTY